MTTGPGLFDTMQRSAVISEDGLYRYRLTRQWGPDSTDIATRPMPFCMLNPSTADAEIDDPTIRRCIGFAKREGAHGITVVNLFAFRATKPAALLDVADPVGPDNAKHISEVMVDTGYLVCAWGAHAHPMVKAMAGAVRKAAQDNGIPLLCLGTTAAGDPRHPLYVPGRQPLVPLARAS